MWTWARYFGRSDTPGKVGRRTCGLRPARRRHPGASNAPAVSPLRCRFARYVYIHTAMSHLTGEGLGRHDEVVLPIGHVAVNRCRDLSV